MNDAPSAWKRSYALLFGGQAASLIGSAITQFALIWWLTVHSGGSAKALATASLAGMLPAVLIGPFAGALVDRWNRKRTIMATDAVAAVMAAAIALLWQFDALSPALLYVGLAIRAAAGAFQFPAVASATPRLVPPDQLTRVSGFQQMIQSAVTIGAPPIGALLMAWLPLSAVAAVDVLTAAVAIPLTAAIAWTDAPTQPRPTRELFREIGDGFRYVVRWRGLLTLLCVGLLLNFLLVPVFSLLPVFVKKQLAGGAPLLAGLETALGVGGILGGLLLGAWGGFRRKTVNTAVGLCGLGVAVFAIGMADRSSVWIAWAAMALVGFGAPICNGPLMAVIQTRVAPEMMGRVMTAMMSLSGGIAPLGLALAGPLSDRYGIPFWYRVAGAVSLAMAGFVFISPAIRSFEEGPTRKADAPPVAPEEASA